MRSEPFATPDNIKKKTSLWLAEVYGYVRPRRNLVLSTDKCALLIVDMLRHFADPSGRVYLPSTKASIPVMRQLLDHWRDHGGTVAFTRHCHKGPNDLGMLGKFFDDYIRCGEEDSHIIDELSPTQEERVFRKDTYDAFYGTDLEEYLESRSVEQVLVTGVLTQMCCETTARSAFVRGFEVYIAADALTTSSERLHVDSLLGMATCCAVITRSSTILGS
ncbi:MAG: isochorismatase family protein [Candidatus Aegiribacteria sp.]|nr:isochorismatase family protein [Candidatus Aegiribacteria sp.]MBD3294441.1 isochorismatase family protein [Candidatus Fermentibacteria bacterium]